MASYVIRRVIQSIPILFGISVLIFAIVQLAPGSPVDRFRVPRVPPEQIEALIRLYGLDKPLLEQYVSWITAFVQVWRIDAWGYSFIDGRPVISNILDRLPATFILMGTALIITIVFSIPIGILAAVKQYSWTDKVITTFATIGYAIPSFLLGIYVWYLGGVVLADLTRDIFGTPWGFPLFGRQSLGSDNDPLDLAFHLVLPVTSLAIQSIAGYSRYLRASMLDVMRQDYVRTARAKGASGARVIGRHALRNALIPLITLIGLSIPSLIAGAVITEFIFSYPGLGQLTITAIGQNDYPTIYATGMLIGTMVIVGNLFADILYGVVDPRIKY
ncbi:MAG: ABC transporter permease [Candidatus Limnocylindrales bacterium]